METAQRIVLGSATAIAAIAVVLSFTFAFVLAPLIVGGGFLLVFFLYQASRKSISRR
jgi:hypothetical protein